MEPLAVHGVYPLESLVQAIEGVNERLSPAQGRSPRKPGPLPSRNNPIRPLADHRRQLGIQYPSSTKPAVEARIQPDGKASTSAGPAMPSCGSGTSSRAKTGRLSRRCCPSGLRKGLQWLGVG